MHAPIQHAPTKAQTHAPMHTHMYTPTHPSTHRPIDPLTHRPIDPLTHPACTCKGVHTCTYPSMTHPCARARARTHTRTHSHTLSHTHPSIHTCTHPAINAHVDTCVCIYLCVHGMCIHTSLHMPVCSYQGSDNACVLNRRIPMVCDRQYSGMCAVLDGRSHSHSTWKNR